MLFNHVEVANKLSIRITVQMESCSYYLKLVQDCVAASRSICYIDSYIYGVCHIVLLLRRQAKL
jgi:hypothetical protein